MDTLQIVMKPLVDAYGFHRGDIAESGINPLNADAVVSEPLPSLPLLFGLFWRWSGLWVQSRDARREQWHVADTPSQLWKPSSPDDYAPTGYVRWMPGQNPTMSAAGALTAAKFKQWAAIKVDREAAEIGGFECAGCRFDSSRVSQARILLAAQAAAFDKTQTFCWTLKDNSTVVLTAAEMQAVAVALNKHVAACHEKGRGLRAQINQSAESDALGRVKW